MIVVLLVVMVFRFGLSRFKLNARPFLPYRGLVDCDPFQIDNMPLFTYTSSVFHGGAWFVRVLDTVLFPKPKSRVDLPVSTLCF